MTSGEAIRFKYDNVIHLCSSGVQQTGKSEISYNVHRTRHVILIQKAILYDNTTLRIYNNAITAR